MIPEIILIQKIKQIFLENRETCHHWINFEIYDALNDSLKEIYVDQFTIPRLSWWQNGEKIEVICKANHLDNLNLAVCKCTEQYPKSGEEIKKILKEFKNERKEKREENKESR